MSKPQDGAQIYSRMEFKGIASESAGSDDAFKFIRTNEDGLLDISFYPTILSTHLTDYSLHLTSGQNTLLDGITVPFAKINFLSTVTSDIQIQLDSKSSDLTTHIGDTSKHLTTSQNTLLDGITVTFDKINYLSTVTSDVQVQLDTHIIDATKHLTSTQNTLLDGITVTFDKINYLSTVSSDVQTQITARALGSDLTTHIADATKHLTSTQNTLLDGITVTFDKINYLSTTSSDVQTQLDAKIPSTYLDTDTALAANSDSKIASQKAIKAYVDAGNLTVDTTWAVNTATPDKTLVLADFTPAGSFTTGLETQVVNLTKKVAALQAALHSRKYPNN